MCIPWGARFAAGTWRIFVTLKVPLRGLFLCAFYQRKDGFSVPGQSLKDHPDGGSHVLLAGRRSGDTGAAGGSVKVAPLPPP
ncbi:hypothetical protein NDU88_008886 [Pleurodeles waltl]|uniref:Uncharacterized protein n=1 Tax=Pleurodeles waltl TaxID=8319 RepID=A0AAV7QPX0_PLEWA|nr:hypothetical protein NDU88_008886 [Pleurodeles waltl]